MRMLERNKQSFFYAAKTGEQYIMDGIRKTGERVPVYGVAAEGKAHISAARGEYETGIFGNAGKYDKIIVFESGKYPVAETTILWIDDTDTSHPHDYEVCRISASLNVTTALVHKVNVNA